MDNELTEQEAAWLDTLRDGSGPTGTVDPHDIRELVRLAQRGRKVVTDAEQRRRDDEYDRGVAEQLEKVAAYYRTSRGRRKGGTDLKYTVKSLVREFVNGWSL